MSLVYILQHVEAEPPGRIADALDAKGIPYQIRCIYDGDSVPQTMDGAAGLVVMGGPMGVGDVDTRPHLRDELHLIEDALRRDRPILGVCLGSQLLAHVLGADVRPGDALEIGWHDVMLTEAASTDPLWHSLGPRFTAVHWHGDVFDLPDGAVSLAQSAQTTYQAFRYGAAAYGQMFHVELTPDLIAGMTRAFPDDVEAAGESAAAIRRATATHEPLMAAVAETVFARWAGLVPHV